MYHRGLGPPGGGPAWARTWRHRAPVERRRGAKAASAKIEAREDELECGAKRAFLRLGWLEGQRRGGGRVNFLNAPRRPGRRRTPAHADARRIHPPRPMD